MSKSRKLLSILKNAHDVLTIVDSIVDVDRLIAVSNAQGPQGKLIKEIINDLGNELPARDEVDIVKPRPRRPKQLKGKA